MAKLTFFFFDEREGRGEEKRERKKRRREEAVSNSSHLLSPTLLSSLSVELLSQRDEYEVLPDFKFKSSLHLYPRVESFKTKIELDENPKVKAALLKYAGKHLLFCSLYLFFSFSSLFSLLSSSPLLPLFFPLFFLTSIFSENTESFRLNLCLNLLNKVSNPQLFNNLQMGCLGVHQVLSLSLLFPPSSLLLPLPSTSFFLLSLETNNQKRNHFQMLFTENVNSMRKNLKK